MNADQLFNLLRKFKCLNETLVNITAVNALPVKVIKHFPQLRIINTDPIQNPGKHRICVIFHDTSNSDFYDSLGKSPKFYSEKLMKFIEDNSKNECTFIQKKIQSNSSDTCGLYVVFFALMRICFNNSVDSIYDMFFTENLSVNDDFVSSYFKNLE